MGRGTVEEEGSRRYLKLDLRERRAEEERASAFKSVALLDGGAWVGVEDGGLGVAVAGIGD